MGAALRVSQGRPPLSTNGGPVNVLLTFNDENQCAPEFTRVLHGLGHAVHHLQLSGHQPILQDPAYQERVLARLEETIQALAIELYFPLFEEVFFLSAHEPKCRTLYCTPQTYADLHLKRRAAPFCQRHGLPHIPTHLLEPETGADELNRLGKSPFFLKEDNSRGGHGSEVYPDARSLLASVPGAPSQYVVQPCVNGELWVIQGVFREGSLWDYEILRKLSFWNVQGTVRKLPFHRVESNPRALELLREVGRLTHYQGMLEFECLGQGDDLQIMEFNPRFSADFVHATQTGSNFCLNTVRAYAGQEALPHRSVEGPITRNAWKLIRSVGRQAPRRLALLDPRWPIRWMLAEASAGWTRLRHPYGAFKATPDSYRRLDFPASGA